MVSLLQTWRVTSKPGIHIFSQPPPSPFFFLTVNLLLWGAYWHLGLSICIYHRSFCPKKFQGHLRRRQIFLIFCPFLLMPCGNGDVNGTSCGVDLQLVDSGFWNSEIYFTYRADCRLCSGMRAGRLCVHGSCFPTTSIFSIHVTPVDTFGASKAQGTSICCLREFQGGWQMDRHPSSLTTWDLHEAHIYSWPSSSCGLCCRPAWSWCVAVLMNMAITYILKSFFFYVFF